MKNSNQTNSIEKIDLKLVSIIPIEFLTDKNRSLCESYLVYNDFLSICDGYEFDIFKEISSGYSKYYETTNKLSLTAKVIFTDSSCCLVLENKKKDWVISTNQIVAELKARNILHKNIITYSKKNPLFDLFNEIKSSSIDTELISINYVFSYYLIYKDILTEEECFLLKHLAEPSLIDLDDMLTSDVKNCSVSVEQKLDLDKLVKDYDISTFSKTFITWATIVSIIQKEPNKGKTEALIKALEFKVQSVWNRCYTLENYIDNIISRESSYTDADDVYWSFSTTLDKVSRVLTSTLSTRANGLFKGMVKTSSLEIEISKLKEKFSLLEKYIKKRSDKINKKYSLIVELLLFITAISSVGQLLFPLPLINNNTIGWAILLVIMIIGIIGIINSKK